MGVFNSIEELQNHVKSRQQAGERQKVNYLRLKDGESVTIWFLQDLFPTDDSTPRALAVTEHVNPKMWQRKNLCTIDEEGRCLGCEMNSKHPKEGWNQKGNMYFNVLVQRNAGDEPEVAVLQQSMSKQSAYGTIMEWITEEGSLMGYTFKLSRKGEKKETSYTLINKPSGKIPDLSKYELVELEGNVVLNVPYANQAALYKIDEYNEEAPDDPWADEDEAVKTTAYEEATWD